MAVEQLKLLDHVQQLPYMDDGRRQHSGVELRLI